ncbi:flavodoxin, long chain [Bacteroidales bacterium 6E]|nr:flavodoxin, long chain [Bacteroidales bacterium 6E]
MGKIGIFYSFNSQKTKLIGEKIIELFNEGEIEAINAETVSEEEFLRYDRMILGVPTWFDGELPNYWDEFVPAIEDLDMTGKKVAIYGLADQKGYPENFGDAVGLMANLLKQRGAEIVGETSTEGYTFESSRAIQNGKFVGLILDQENQARLTQARLDMWIKQVKENF